jgi:HK97 family phage major capsid protein
MSKTLKQLQDERATKMADIEAAETIDELKAANEAINAIDAQIELISQKSAMLAQLGTKDGAPAQVVTSDDGLTLGQHFVKSVDFSTLDPSRNFTVFGAEFGASGGAFGAKSAAPMGLPANTTLTQPVTNVVEAPRFDVGIGDLFTVMPLENGNSVEWFEEGTTVEGGFAIVAELGAKPMTSWGYTPKSGTLKKVAGHYKESAELLEDAPRLAAAIDSRGVYLHSLAEANQYLNGSGSSGNMMGLLNTSGIQSTTYTHGGAMTFDTILTALGKVPTSSGLMADNIILNPTDYYALLAIKDDNKQYLAGGPIFGPYGQPMPVVMRVHVPFWNTPTYVTPVIAQGTAAVGAFKLGGKLYRKGGKRVGIYNQNEDDAIKNAITIVVESRSLLAIEKPFAFVKITEAAS